MKNNSRQKWIDAGYELFAKDGPEDIQVERLARILRRNKSGFYHYFKTSENFLRQVFNHHLTIANLMAIEIRGCETLDPDYFDVVVKFKLFVLVQGQLIRRGNISQYDTVHKEAIEITNIHLLPLWQKSLALPRDPVLVFKHYTLFRNAFHAQVNFDNLTYEFLHAMKSETSKMMSEVFRHSRWKERGTESDYVLSIKNPIPLQSYLL